MPRSWPYPWLLALAALTALRLLAAAMVPLSPDEAYYWTWSHALAPGYLDHPPMVALWIKAGTALAGEGALGVRLLAPLSAAAGSVLLARAAEARFPGGRAGVPAAALLNGTLLLGVGAATMTPDTPLLFFWTAALWALAQVLRTGRGWWWLAVGAAAGGALDSKYTAVLLGLGIALWLLLVPSVRFWLRRPWPWLGGLLAAAMFAPVVAWNAGHGWASFAKQGGRTGDWRPADALRFLAELLGSQVGLATPLVFAACCAGTWAAIRGARRRDPAWSLLAALVAPGALVFVQHAVGDRVQGNWPAILYPAAAVAAAAAGWRWWRASAALGLLLTVLLYVQAAAAPLRLPRRWDVALIRLGGWPALATEVEAARQREGAEFVVAEPYGAAALLARDLPAGVSVVGLESRWALLPLPSATGRIAGRPGLLVRTARRGELPDTADWSELREVGRAARARGGVVAEEYVLYRGVIRPTLADPAAGPRASTALPRPEEPR